MSRITLERLAKKHHKWILSVINMGCNVSYAEDIVQDSYIRIHEYLNKGTNIDYGDDDVNDYYFWCVLRSVYINKQKSSKVNHVSYSEVEKLDDTLNNLKSEYADVEMEDAYDILIKNIFREINTWDFYNKNLFIAYFTSSLSITKLSNETLIGRSSVYNSVKKYRDVIKDIFYEDMEDFKNKDYDKIKEYDKTTRTIKREKS